MNIAPQIMTIKLKSADKIGKKKTSLTDFGSYGPSRIINGIHWGPKSWSHLQIKIIHSS